MPVNRNALIRYRTLDNCLRNRYRLWTLEDLINACSDALYEYEGIDKGVSRRTVQMDIQLMRSDKLGYNAPIIVKDRKYYTYEDPEYSITNIPLSNQDLNTLGEIKDILRQFKGFSHFQELTGVVQKLEDKIHTAQTNTPSIVQLETNENLQGLEHLDTLYRGILNKKALSITYQSFKARNPAQFTFHAQLLKEFRNRWFVFGFKSEKQKPLLLALDRIQGIEKDESPYIENNTFHLREFFNPVIGVTVEPGKKAQQVELFVQKEHAPYILTKPLHASQKVVDQNDKGVRIQLEVQLNFELEKELLSYGESVQVLRPEKLVKRMADRLNKARKLYK